MPAIRAFIALDLSAAIRTQLGGIIQQFQTARLPAVHWVHPNNIHLTLKFLGDVSPSNLEILTRLLHTETARHHRFEVQVGGLGAFPSIHRPRVIWVGVKPQPALLTLQRAIDSETVRLGYSSEDRPFSPHLTLGRVAHNATSADVQRIAEALANVHVGDLGTVSIQDVRLYRSDLRPDGAVYTLLFSAALRQ